ncbi:ATP-binding protein [Flavobacterium sp. LS2R12]|uniref:ATP-binding protein n=1 Tax=unclassified Flavobacterium TaxID=196869 RepID=UPI003AAC12D5
MMLLKSPFGFAILKGKNMVITLANDSVKEMWGKGNHLEGKTLLEVLPEIKDSEFPDLLDKVYTSGTPFCGDEVLCPVFRNGKLEDVYFNFVYQPYLEADETISGITIIAYEVTAAVIVKNALAALHDADQKALKKIEESNNRYYMMLMDSPFAFCVMKGKDMVVTLANDLIKEFWGKGKDVEGKTLLEVLPEIKDQPFPEMIEKVYTTGIPLYANEILGKVTCNGKLKHKYFNVVFQPYYEADNSISGVTQIAYEVTEMVMARKKIEESEQRFRQLVNSMPQKITHADAAGNVIFFNQQWINETGYNMQELLNGEWIKAVHHEDIKHTADSWLNAVNTGTTHEVECRILNKKLGFRWNLSRAVPVKDENGKIKVWIGSTTDIHDQKEAKSKAETAQVAAEDAMQAKQQFLSNMSHEIRTPMNAIIGFTNVLLKSKLDQSQEDYLTAIKDSGDALLVLINDILDLAKVDAGKMTFEQTPFNLADSLSSMLQLFDMKIKEKNLELVKQFDTAIPEIIMGDSIRLRQIILNLISNAVKFTSAGKITICVSLLKQDAEEITIEFTITDTGIGIHKTKLEHIFDDFGQATYENSRLYGGTGLGLTIVKKLIEQQGGTIRVESELGKGSAFSFQLNFAKTNQKIEHESEPVSNIQSEVKKINILVAEDMPLNQLLIKIILADFGFEVDIADNGKIAIEKLEQKKYDLVLMDLQMPEMNGFDATAYVRNIMKSNIPIIALTADVTSVDLEKAQAMGMNDYVSKPVDEQLLYSKIIKVLQKTD